MKKIAGILLLIFTLVQAGPAVHALCSNTAAIFMADEEKGDDKPDKTEKKEKKYYSLFTAQTRPATIKITSALLLAEKIFTPPCLEKLTPPPNFC